MIHGLPVLEVSSKLDTSAQRWTDKMEAEGIFEHGSDQAFSNRLLAVGYNWSEAGENIATGFLTPRDVVSGWMASTDHCQNVLDPDFRAMGTGVDVPPITGWAVGQGTWTQDFGIEQGQSQLSHNYGPMNGCPYSIPSSPPQGSSGSTT